MNELHVAARDGSIEHTVAVITRGAVDIDEGESHGYTPLIIAATSGHAGVVRILLNKGANVSIVSDKKGLAALHCSAHGGHLAVTKLLVNAGADLETKATSRGCTPLELAAEKGHSEVMGVLIEAGANPNSRTSGGSTSLYMAAQEGHLAATQVLLRAKANPLLTSSDPSGKEAVPLDVAAHNGHLKLVDELIQEYGIEGCGGASGGVHALEFAAQNQHVEIMDMLTSAGVVDTGIALISAVSSGRESSAKFLLQQQEERASGQGAGYLETLNRIGATPLVCSIQACRSCSPRITRLLMDAGAVTRTAVQLKDIEGRVAFDGTPLAVVDFYLITKIIKGKEATEGQLHSLEGTRRLLLRVEAIHAVSWTRSAPFSTHAVAEGTGRATETTPTPLVPMLPILRRRAGRPRVLLAALFRHSRKPC